MAGARVFHPGEVEVVAHEVAESAGRESVPVSGDEEPRIRFARIGKLRPRLAEVFADPVESAGTCRNQSRFSPLAAADADLASVKVQVLEGDLSEFGTP